MNLPSGKLGTALVAIAAVVIYAKVVRNLAAKGGADSIWAKISI